MVATTDGAVRTIRIDRPRAGNALTLATKDLLLGELQRAAADPAVRAVVLTGTGRAFCAGQDLREHAALLAAGDPRVSSTVRDFYNAAILTITGMRKPVVAVVNGVTAGAGLGFACACDLRVAGRSATFTAAFAGVALAADSGVSFLLPRLVGSGRASRMLLLGERWDADQALAAGLVDAVVDDADLADEGRRLATRLAEGPTEAFAWIKASLHHAASTDLASALSFEEAAQGALFRGEDHRDAVAAFLAKQRPTYRGR
ncbi:enoyl-CoA hydratase/isomerase family protein [Nakamurella endophytica]|uniref:enoyl-CoA hydratase/isomerase family protein n=1 Tax=Nakamurella endophytica TaxID=1748367 RepID=UPI001E43F034|nr:enoyl-CoA hydratase-related protein [Nakamurella endophytica]